MDVKVRQLVGRSVVRLVEYSRSGLNVDYAEYERLANMASEAYKAQPYMLNEGRLEVAISEQLASKGIRM